MNSSNEETCYNERQKESRMTQYRNKNGLRAQKGSMTIRVSPEQQQDKVIGIKIVKQGTFTKKLKKSKLSSQNSNQKHVKMDGSATDGLNP